MSQFYWLHVVHINHCTSAHIGKKYKFIVVFDLAITSLASGLPLFISVLIFSEGDLVYTKAALYCCAKYSICSANYANVTIVYSNSPFPSPDCVVH